MRVLITGGAGFIGSHVVEAGRQAGWEIWVVDDLSRGSRTHLPADIPLLVMDVRDPALEELTVDFRPAVIHHLAAQVDVAASVADPWHDASVNLLGTLRVLRAALRGGARQVVLASSAAVYGEPERLPVAEEHPLRPLSPYGLSKAAAEAYARWFGAHHGLEVTILRYGNVYGPRQPAVGEAGVIARFLAALADGERPVIHGDGRQVRDFIYVGDVAAAHLQATARGAGGIYNIGTGRAISIRGALSADAAGNRCGGRARPWPSAAGGHPADGPGHPSGSGGAGMDPTGRIAGGPGPNLEMGEGGKARPMRLDVLIGVVASPSGHKQDA